MTFSYNKKKISIFATVLRIFLSVDDDYLQNASAILDKLKSYYRQGGESTSLPKVLQDFTQVLHYSSSRLLKRKKENNFVGSFFCSKCVFVCNFCSTFML